MNEEEFTALAQLLSKQLGEAAVNHTMVLMIVINALKKQPNFDETAFLNEIRRSIDTMSDDNSVAKLMLSAVLPETYADHPQ